MSFSADFSTIPEKTWETLTIIENQRMVMIIIITFYKEGDTRRIIAYQSRLFINYDAK